uniref:Uncharacterized protein n=1 Tax=Oryza sativa subsp. japonica TaxID=39947 RepID=Q2QPJ3_ORYSJ|nr:hypothetical protein LOC_Os12g34280 [Oryza sativa Japonica Group]
MKRPAEAARREAGGRGGMRRRVRRRSSWPAAEGCGGARTSSWREAAGSEEGCGGAQTSSWRDAAARTWERREPAACGSGAEGAVGGVAVIVVVEEGGRWRRGGRRRLADVGEEGAGKEGGGGSRTCGGSRTWERREPADHIRCACENLFSQASLKWSACENDFRWRRLSGFS